MERRAEPSEPKVQKLVEVALRVIAERRAVLEAVAAVERQGRLERRAAAGLQAQVTQPSPATLGDDVGEQGLGDSLAQVVR